MLGQGSHVASGSNLDLFCWLGVSIGHDLAVDFKALLGALLNSLGGVGILFVGQAGHTVVVVMVVKTK